MATGSFTSHNYSSSQSEVLRDHYNGAQRINPENRVGSSFRIIPEQYFSGIENIDDFLENIDHNLAYYEIPAQLACAYLKGHLKGRALDWFEVLGYRVIEDNTTDYAHLKQALSEQFPVVRNRSELETRFYSSSQRRDQQPSDFIYELLKIHKVLKLEMSEEKLIDHVISRLEPQILIMSKLDIHEILPISYKSLINTKNVLCIDKSEVRMRDLEVQALMKTIVLIPDIDKKIGGKTEIMRDTPIIADHKGNLIDTKTKVSQIADSKVDAKVDNRINHSTVKAVDKAGREIVHFEVKMKEVEI
ncbi:uncharacterized protein TNCV_4896741 [Trichonephila clavipes]|uniref:Retrotransposon gag domain-containing protein n=1 Tax=Trichonephila clavipes TaxID=2585209 RepID=A0A8X6VWS4_TRICX|nr:uncharacterized protein TNCV_4896741 [Trichonephila clavipes]